MTVVRFVLGGAIVSAFSVVGEVVKPRTFSGLFGTAPSVALVSLALAAMDHGVGHAATSARSMLIGAASVFPYGAACVMGIRRQDWPVWLAAGGSWLAWLLVAFALSGLGRLAGFLS